MDPRQPKEGVFAWSTGGAVLSLDLIENFVPFLARIAEVQLVTHSDCAFTRTQLGFPAEGPLRPDDAQTVEQETARRRAQMARRLLAHPKVREAVAAGLRFRMGHYDVMSRLTHWLEAETHAALAEAGLDLPSSRPGRP